MKSDEFLKELKTQPAPTLTQKQLATQQRAEKIVSQHKNLFARLAA